MEITLLSLALLVTLPVLIGITIAGWLGARTGHAGLWLGTVAMACLAVLVWGLQAPPGTDRMQSFGAALAVYAPAFVLGAVILAVSGPARLTRGYVGVIAVAISGANIFVAQFFFVMGCAANLWACP